MTAVWGVLDLASLALAFALGLLVGAVTFGGLWWTLTRLRRWRRPGLALAISFALRTAFALAAFAWLARLGLAAVLAALVGFFAVRGVATLRLAPRPREEGEA